MQRGTTPTLSFAIPIDTSLLDAVWVTLSQNDTEIVTKTMSECELDGNIIRAKLTQADTLRLSTDYDTLKVFASSVGPLQDEHFNSCKISFVI